MKREILLTRRYLLLPVKNGAPKRRLTLRIDGRLVHEWEMELAEGAPDFRVFLDVAAFRGRTAFLEVDGGGLDGVGEGDEIEDEKQAYAEAGRPRFHFTS